MAQWSIDKRLITTSHTDGTQSVSVPLLDGGVKAGTLTLSMTADRHLRVDWDGEPGAEPLAGFEAWSDQ